MTTSTHAKPDTVHRVIPPVNQTYQPTELSELLDKMDLGTKRPISAPLVDMTDSATKRLLSIVVSPIILILFVWAALFCLYGREIIAGIAPFAR